MCKQLGKGAVADLVARGIPHRTIDRIKDVMPAQICYVLESHGWQEIRSHKPNTRVWQKSDVCDNTFHQVTVPYDKNDEDYEMILASAVYSLYLCGGIPLDAILENEWQKNEKLSEK